jgi:hypothetical protein
VIHILIFSKDRACQLELLLRTMADFGISAGARVTILYRATHERHEQAYQLAQSISDFNRLRWHVETSFRADLLSLLRPIGASDFVMFLVDDIIFINSFDMAYLLSRCTERHLFASLRVNRTYEGDAPRPDFLREADYLEWKWNYTEGYKTWNYPFSVDGNIYRAATITKVIESLPIIGVQSLEGLMHDCRHQWRFRWLRPLAVAPPYPLLFNNPMNRVENERTDGGLWNGGVNPETLNQMFLSGKRLDSVKMSRLRPAGTHHFFEPVFQ